MPRVLRTLQANIDLLEIWCAVAEENIDAADKLLESFSSKPQTLATQPMMGPFERRIFSSVTELFHRKVCNFLPAHR